MTVCSCALHDNRPAPIGVCTCLCQEHDQFFDQGVVLVRQAVRRYQRVVQDEAKGVHNRLNAVNQLYDTVSADLSRLRSEVRGVASTVDRIIDRVDAIEERLSPPETVSLSEMSIRAMEEKSRTKGLPPDVWDRYGVRWTCKGRAPVPGRNTDDFLWEAVVPAHKGGERIAQMLGENLEALRGPFTETSPLAEDQEPLPDAGEAKDADPDDEDGEWINLHAFVPGTVTAEKCEVCGGPADGLLHEQSRGSGLWSEPWEPQFSDEDTDVLSIAIRQAVGAASACWQNLEGAGVFDDQKALWVASGFQRWIESRYQLFDQPAYQMYQSAEFDHLPKSERGRARRQASRDDQTLINRALKAEAEVRDLRRALGELRTDFIRIQAIAGQHAAYEGNSA